MDDEALHDIAAGCQYRPEEYAVMARELLALRRADAVKQALIEAATRWRYAAAHVTVHAVGGHDQRIEDEYSGAACALCRALDRAANHASPAPAEAAAPMREGGAETIPRGEGWRVTAPWRIGFGPHDGDALGAAVENAIRAAEARVRAECWPETEKAMRERDAAEKEVERLNGYVQRLTTQRDAARRERDAATAQQTRAAGVGKAAECQAARTALACELSALRDGGEGYSVVRALDAYLATRPGAAAIMSTTPEETR